MSKVIADITMSLDGFVTGEGPDEQHGLGDAPKPRAEMSVRIDTRWARRLGVMCAA
jgi:hypothetical protein